MKFGFEREFFVTKDDQYVLADTLPHDACGYLAEVRGEPHNDPAKALALYNIEEGNIKRRAEDQGLRLVLLDWIKLPKSIKNIALRRFGKNPSINEGSMYGKFWSEGIQRAGLHVHFSNEIEVNIGRDIRKIPGILDLPKFIFGLDKIFAKEIKEAKRVPGLYEMKPHGFEYRSLPASVDMKKVANALVVLEHNRYSTELVIA